MRVRAPGIGELEYLDRGARRYRVHKMDWGGGRVPGIVGLEYLGQGAGLPVDRGVRVPDMPLGLENLG